MFIEAKKSLGQNFLVDPNVGKKIVGLLNSSPGERVLEIGPGLGALTSLLLDGHLKVFALEKDFRLAKMLKDQFSGLEVINGDALKICWPKVCEFIPAVLGNLPYNIASALIWQLSEACRPGQRLVFTVQKEVGLRLSAKPGFKSYGALSAWIQNFVNTRIAFTLSPSVFRPRPKVDSAVVCISPNLKNVPGPEERFELAGLIKYCFARRRKQMGKVLKHCWSSVIEDWLKSQGMDKRARPENLSPYQFKELNLLLKDLNLTEKFL